MDRLNLIVICLDTMRADIIGSGGALSEVSTPHMDAFARDAVRFTRAFGEGQPTLQTRRSLFTGRRSFPWRYNFDRRGLWHHNPGWHKIPPEQDTLSEILLRHGYLSGLVSDTYHMFKPTTNFSRGFTSYEFIRGQEDDNWQPPALADPQTALAPYVRNPTDWRRYPDLLQYLANQRDRKGEADYQCARVFTRATEWIARAYRDGPFFLWVDSFDPHEPWDPPRAYADRHFAQGPWTGIEWIDPGELDEEATTEDKARVRALYCGEVSFVDHWVGTLFAALTSADLWRNSVVMLISDHGTELGEHGRYGKGPAHLHPYNTQINWMVADPRVRRAHAVPQFVQTHDLLPTALELLGLPEVPVDGASAWGFVNEPGRRGRDHIVTGWADFSRRVAGGRAAVRTDEWNYVVTCDGPDRDQELYHLASDPDERRNVVAEHPHVADRLRGHVEATIGQSLPARFVEVSDPGPAPVHEFTRARRRR